MDVSYVQHGFMLKCVFPNASEAKLKILFEFNSSFDVKCQEYKQKQKVKLTNSVTKKDFNNFTSVEQKIKSGPNFIKECGKETFANIATTIQNNLADAPFFQQFSKKQEEEDKNKRQKQSHTVWFTRMYIRLFNYLYQG